MSFLVEQLAQFHFIRPVWLSLIPLTVFLWWQVRRTAAAVDSPPVGIAPHLAAALTIGDGKIRKLKPIDGVVLVILLLALTAAGPAWTRAPNPFVAETAPLMVALEVSETMLATDVPPTRLERARHKILDLVSDRAGARTGLVAYAGTAHRVVPLTEDPEVLKPFLEGLSPEVMPRPGQDATAALDLARGMLSEEQTPGAILFVLDTLDGADVSAFRQAAAEGAPPIVFLSFGTAEPGSIRRADGSSMPAPPDSAVDAAALNRLSAIEGTDLVRATPDRADVRRIERRLASAYRAALDRDERMAWEDRSQLFLLPAMIIALFWFRRGWTMRWGALCFVLTILLPTGSARADGLVDLFLTADQQGQIAYNEKDFARAGDLFEDPMWKGAALFRAGRYIEAADAFARGPDAEAAFAMGTALVRGREYARAVEAFELALEQDPRHTKAARNLEITLAIIAYLETARSESGTEGMLGADDVRFDNTSGAGQEAVITGRDRLKVEAAEEWMRAVDTRTADFLRIRFSLEAAAGRGE